MSKRLITSLLSVLLAFTLTTNAGPSSKTEREEMRTLKIEQVKLKAQERMLKLKQALKLQESQLDEWAAYENHLQANIGNKMKMVKQLKKKQAKSKKPPSSIELAKANISRLEKKLQSAKERFVVFSKLYDVLDDNQRQTIDKLAHKKVKNAAKMLREKRKHMKEH